METNLEQDEQAWLIGDSGYPLSKHVMTPFLNPSAGTPQARFNQAHMRARNVVERTFGVFKMRFVTKNNDNNKYDNILDKILCGQVSMCLKGKNC